MTLANGDPFVVGDIFSFQQAERMKDNWRAAAEPSNPQAGSLWSDSVNEKLFHRQAAAYKEIVQVETQIDGYVDLVLLSTLAAGGFGLRIDAYQDDTTGLTGLLRGAYIQASNGDIISTGTIRALELKARAGRPGEVGNDIAVLEGLSISADAKVYDITTVMRGAEVILDGGAGASIVKAVGIRIANNFQADIATLCYGLEIYRDSFDYDADIALSSGGLIGGSAGHVKVADDGTTTLTAKGLLLEGTARVNNEQWLDAEGIKAPQTNPAELISHGDLETPAFQFADAIEANQESVTFDFRLPNRMDKTVAPTIILGWSADGVSPGNCKWQLEYLWRAPGEDTGGAAQETLTVIGTAAAVADGLVISTLTGIDLPSATDACLHCRLTRLSADGADTIADTVELHGVCLNWTSNKLGAAT